MGKKVLEREARQAEEQPAPKSATPDAKGFSRRSFVAVAGTMGALGALGAFGCAPQSATSDPEAGEADAGEWHGVADEVTTEITVDVPGKPEDDGTYHVTFNGGPLTAAEQHAVLDSYDWRENRLTASQIAEDAKAMSDEEAEKILFNEPEITQDYVTESGKVIPAVYIALRNRLLRVGQGVGAEIHENAWDFLMQEFSEDEAAFYLKLPNFAYFTESEAGEATGMPAEEAGAICEDLSYRGLLNRVHRSGTKYYHVLAFAHGMLEFMMNRYEEEGFCDSVFGMCGADYGYQSRNQGSPMYFPIPAQADIVGDTEILPNHDWNEIIDRYDTLPMPHVHTHPQRTETRRLVRPSHGNVHCHRRTGPVLHRKRHRPPNRQGRSARDPAARRGCRNGYRGHVHGGMRRDLPVPRRLLRHSARLHKPGRRRGKLSSHVPLRTAG